MPTFADVEFHYLFIERDRRRVDHLRSEIAARGTLPTNVQVRLEHGEFEATFSTLLDGITDGGTTLVPTFAFIDPFGYSTASMSLTGRPLAYPRCEVLVFLPLSFVHRFVREHLRDEVVRDGLVEQVAHRYDARHGGLSPPKRSVDHGLRIP